MLVTHSPPHSMPESHTRGASLPATSISAGSIPTGLGRKPNPFKDVSDWKPPLQKEKNKQTKTRSSRLEEGFALRP